MLLFIRRLFANSDRGWKIEEGFFSPSLPWSSKSPHSSLVSRILGGNLGGRGGGGKMRDEGLRQGVYEAFLLLPPTYCLLYCRRVKGVLPHSDTFWVCYAVSQLNEQRVIGRRIHVISCIICIFICTVIGNIGILISFVIYVLNKKSAVPVLIYLYACIV